MRRLRLPANKPTSQTTPKNRHTRTNHHLPQMRRPSHMDSRHHHHHPQMRPLRTQNTPHPRQPSPPTPRHDLPTMRTNHDQRTRRSHRGNPPPPAYHHQPTTITTPDTHTSHKIRRARRQQHPTKPTPERKTSRHADKLDTTTNTHYHETSRLHKHTLTPPSPSTTRTPPAQTAEKGRRMTKPITLRPPNTGNETHKHNPTSPQPHHTNPTSRVP